VRDFLQTAVGRDDVIPGAVVAIQTFGNLGDLTPHLHMIVSWGCFDGNGTFYAVRQAPDEEMVEQVFRHKVFRMLLDEDAVTEELVNDLLAWRHSGFSACAEIVCEPFYDDLEPGEVEELMMAAGGVGRN
jgi:hypothetical protein